MLNLTIGGVPEHFNLPWQLVLEAGQPQDLNINAQWRDYPAGTGAMVAALNSGELDLAMLVTEGAVAARQSPDCQFEILSFYTTSPLLWGIHVPVGSDLHTQTDIAGQRYAISRYGSGSHLMAKVHAHSQGWPAEQLEFVLVENLTGAREAFAQQRAEVFFWEHYTTKPYVDNGEFRWLGDFPPPWPGFVVCVNKTALRSQRTGIEQLLERVFDQARQIKHSERSPELIASRYGLKADDVRDWLHNTRWADKQQLDQATLAAVQAAVNLSE